MVGGLAGLGVELSAPLKVLQDPRFNPLSWFTMCLSYLLYQCCSIVVLSSLAVESHALLVALKHLVVVLLASIWLQDALSFRILIGTFLAGLGVWIYISKSPPPAGNEQQLTETQAEEEGAVRQPERTETGERAGSADLGEVGSVKEKFDPPKIPHSLQALVGLLVLGGALTPLATQVLKMRQHPS